MSKRKLILHVFDYFFFIFHSVLILFILSGWILPATRKLHLFAIALTLFSWVGLGLWKGMGYCICTDIHWKIRRSLGYAENEDGYIHFLVFKISGKKFSPSLVSTLTTAGLISCCLLSIYLNLFS